MQLATIIIVNYNYGMFVAEAIESALSQTHPNVEVIVVDDGSTDTSRRIIERYSDRVTTVFKNNGGQASACNEGFRVSKGSIVIFLDADDLLLPSAIEESLPLFDDCSVAKVHWPMLVINSIGEKTGEIIPKEPLICGHYLEVIKERGPMWVGTPPMSGQAWSRKFLERALPIEEWGDRHAADTFLVTIAPLFGSIKRIAEPLTYYRKHDDNFTKMDMKFIFERDLRYHEHQCALLQKWFSRLNMKVKPEKWQLNKKYYEAMLRLPSEVGAVIPKGKRIILAAQGDVDCDYLTEYDVVNFLDHEGKYWGMPKDDEEAIREVERQKERGAEYIVFTVQARWCVEYFHSFSEYLRRNFLCLKDNDCVLILGGRNNI